MTQNFLSPAQSLCSTLNESRRKVSSLKESLNVRLQDYNGDSPLWKVVKVCPKSR